MENQTTTPAWYENKTVVVLLCIFFFPVGLYALWKNSSISQGWKIGVTLIIVFLVISVMVDDAKDGSQSSTSSNNTSAPSSEQKPEKTSEELRAEREKTTISPNSLINAYNANELSADESFKGKRFHVEGYVDNIGKDILGNPYVTLKTNDIVKSIQCMIDDKARLAQLRKGEKITVLGECRGLTLGISILIEDCQIVPNKEDL